MDIIRELRASLTSQRLAVITDDGSIWPRHNEALCQAARNGHVSILQELRINWGLTSRDAKLAHNYALRLAACRGHVQVLQEFRLNWGLGGDDARGLLNNALALAAEGGQVKVMQELRLNWGLPQPTLAAETARH